MFLFAGVIVGAESSYDFWKKRGYNFDVKVQDKERCIDLWKTILLQAEVKRSFKRNNDAVPTFDKGAASQPPGSPRYKRGKKRKKSALPIQFRRRERKTQVESIEVEAANIISNAAYESFKSIVPTPMNELTSSEIR